MAIGVLLESGSRAARAVDAAWQWTCDVTFRAPTLSARLKKLQGAGDHQSEAAPQEPETIFVALLTSLAHRELRVIADFMTLVGASLTVDYDRTDSGLTAVFTALVARMPDASEKRFGGMEPSIYWQRLLDSVTAASEDLSRAIAVGKTPLPPPTGFFGKLGRSMSGRTLVASARLMDDMQNTLARLTPVEQELRSVIEEMKAV